MLVRIFLIATDPIYNFRWYAGDTINIIGDFVPIASPSSSIKLTVDVSLKSNLLIHHPDNLVTVTAITKLLQCRRNPFFASPQAVRSSSELTPPLIWGTMLHEVMQMCLGSGHWEDCWVHEHINHVITEGLEELVAIGIGVEEATLELKKRTQCFRSFADKYIAETPKVTFPLLILRIF